MQPSHKKQVLYVKVQYSYTDPTTGSTKYGTYTNAVDKRRAAHPSSYVGLQGCEEAVAYIQSRLPPGYSNFSHDCENYTAKG